MTHVTADPGIRLAEATAGAYSGREMLTVALVVLLNALLATGLASAMGTPTVPKYTPSILRDESPAVAVVTTVACVATCAAVGALLAGRMHFDAGVFGAA